MMTNLRNSLQNVQSVSYYAYAAYEYVGYFWRAYFYFRYRRPNAAAASTGGVFTKPFSFYPL